MTKKSSHTRRAVALIGSSWFFRAIVILLVLQAAWVALTGRYPMAFDEDYHLGIIRLYAHHLSPVWGVQPANADSFGAVARDPSYLYHYLMSFPYRLIAAFTGDQTLQVLWLRGLNISLLASALVVYRRLLLKTGASRTIVHSCLLVFVLIPVVPLLAAQINYDNLLVPLVGLVLLITITISDELRTHKRLNVLGLAQLLVLCLLASLVKYAFLPIFMVVGIFLGIRVWQSFRSLPAIWRCLQTCIKKLDWPRKLLYTMLVVLAAGLWVERYGINLVRYHTPVADCAVVLSVEQCNAYGPWVRDHALEAQKTTGGHYPIDFSKEWLYGMWLRLYFAVDGTGTQFQTRGPFIVPALSGIAFAIASFLLLVRYGHRLFAVYNSSALSLLAAASFFYVLVLVLDGYEAYVRTDQPVAINGRYLLPIFLPALLFSLLAAGELLKRRTGLKLILAAVLVACLLCGGGALTYILRSNDAWYWPNGAVRTANHAVQRVLGPVVPGYDRPTEFLRFGCDKGALSSPAYQNVSAWFVPDCPR